MCDRVPERQHFVDKMYQDNETIKLEYQISKNTFLVEPLHSKIGMGHWEHSEKIAVFYDEESFNSFNLIEHDVLKIKSYKHLLKRIEQDSIDSMVASNRAGE